MSRLPEKLSEYLKIRGFEKYRPSLRITTDGGVYIDMTIPVMKIEPSPFLSDVEAENQFVRELPKALTGLNDFLNSADGRNKRIGELMRELMRELK